MTCEKDGAKPEIGDSESRARLDARDFLGTPAQCIDVCRALVGECVIISRSIE